MQVVNSIQDYYAKKGFKIMELRADQKFEPARASLAHMQIKLNASVRNDEVPKIERLNRNMKDRIRPVYMEIIRVYGCIPGFIFHKLVIP